MSSTTERLPRLSSSKIGLAAWSEPRVSKKPRIGSPSGDSILITSAPQSAMIPAAPGAAI
jgi:hypothetical protein